ncbi:MAG: VOC family protein [Pseudomonadota bacterium]
MSYIRNGRCAVRSYIFANSDIEGFIDLLGGETIEKHPTQDGHHLSVAIGDAVMVIEAGDSFPVPTNVSYVYVYVPDVDAVYSALLAYGAKSVSAPEDKPYEERQCGVEDSFGNTWWISTFTG